MPKRVGLANGDRRPNYIRAWRKYRGLSQDKLIDRVVERTGKFSKTSLSRLENGKQAYTQNTLEALAWALSCEPADLLTRDPEAPEAEVIDILARLSPDARRQATAILRALVETDKAV